MFVRNVDPSGSSRDIADHGLVVGHGETAEVDDDLGLRLLEQTDVWALVPAATSALAGGPGPELAAASKKTKRSDLEVGD